VRIQYVFSSAIIRSLSNRVSCIGKSMFAPLYYYIVVSETRGPLLWRCQWVESRMAARAFRGKRSFYISGRTTDRPAPKRSTTGPCRSNASRRRPRFGTLITSRRRSPNTDVNIGAGPVVLGYERKSAVL